MAIRRTKKYWIVLTLLIICALCSWLAAVQNGTPYSAENTNLHSLMDADRIPVPPTSDWEDASNHMLGDGEQPGGGPPNHQGQELRRPIVTMFTTIRDRECRKEIHSRLIKNWAALSPDLDPVLFVPYTEYNSSWISKAISNKWTVRILYALRHNLPTVKTMFKEALAFSDTPFIGYANADILFDRSLISTLRYLNQTLNVRNETIFIVGRRRNVKIERVDLGSGDNLAELSKMDKIKPFHSRAQDYFIISRGGLPWDEIPDFVVGRNGYDNWLVSKALDWNLTLIDASQTVLALHQSGVDGEQSGSRTVTDGTRNLNIELVKGFKFARGNTAFAPFYTKGECSSRGRRASYRYCNQVRKLTLKRKSFKAVSRSRKASGQRGITLGGDV